MKVLVISGSPKGTNSITLQSVNFLNEYFQEDTFDTLHIGSQHKKQTSDEAINAVVSSLGHYDLLLFAYPVYTFLAPYQLHDWIYKFKKAVISQAPFQMFVTQVTTSKHFFDMTAHRYIEENMADIGFTTIRGLSHDMDDLLTTKGQNELVAFFNYVKFSMSLGQSLQKSFIEPHPIKGYVHDPATPQKAKSKHFDTLILTDAAETDTSLLHMIDGFRSLYPGQTRTININSIRIDGGCLGCFKCSTDGTCVYKDRFDDYLRTQIQSAHALVYAFTIKDHSMGPRFKLYDDRQFCNGHRTVSVGMPIAYIISGNYSQEINLKTVIEARAEVGHTLLTDIATDESPTRDETTLRLLHLSEQLNYALENKLVLPQNFYGIGGMKIFRDLIYVMKGLMKADHKFYKKHGIYDFPQKQWKRRLLMDFIGLLMSVPSIRNKATKQMNQVILKPYKKVVRKAHKGT